MGTTKFGDELRVMRQHSNARIANGIKAVSTASSILPLLSMLVFGYATESILVMPRADLSEPSTPRCLELVLLALSILLSVFSITFAVLEFYYIELSSGMHHTSISRFANRSRAPGSAYASSSSVDEGERRQKRQLFELERELDAAIEQMRAANDGGEERAPKATPEGSSSEPQALHTLAHARLEQAQFRVKVLRERLHEKDEQAYLKIEHDHLGRLDRVVDTFIGFRRWARNAMWSSLVTLMAAVAAKLFDAAAVAAADDERPPTHPIIFVCAAILGLGALAVLLMLVWFRASYRPLAQQLGSVR